MNVKRGDRARVVKTGTINDGAIVDVIEIDRQWTQRERRPIWAVRGSGMCEMRGKIPMPFEGEGLLPDANLERVEPDAELKMPPATEAAKNEIAKAAAQAARDVVEVSQ